MHSKEKLLQAILETMSTTLRVPVDKINAGTSMENLSAWDSLNHIAVVVAMEKKFDVSFGQAKILSMTSIMAIEKEVKILLEKK